MNTKIKLIILALTVSTSLILSVYATSRAAGSNRLVTPTTSDLAEPEPLILTDEQGKYPLGLYMDILEDPSGELTIEDVSSPEFDSRFIPSQLEIPNYGFTRSAYWVRLSLNNKSFLTDLWLLEIGFAHTQYVDLYSPSPNGEGFIVKQSGALRPPETRDVRYPRIIFNLIIPTQSEQTIYLRFKNDASMTLPLILWDQNTFMNESIPKDGLLVMFYGVLIGLLIYNIFLLFSFREVSYLYLVLFMSSSAFYFASYDGYTEIYLFPRLYYLKLYYHSLAFITMFVSAILFADTVLELKTRLPFFHRIMIILLSAGGIITLLILFSSYHFLTRPGSAWAILSSTVLLVAGILLWRQGYTPVRYYMAAWFVFLLGITLNLLARLGFITSNFFTENAFRLGLVWVAVGWSLVLADRVHLLRIETEVANLNLQNSEHRLSQILEGMPLGVIVYGKDQKSKYLNQRTVEILSNPAQGTGPDIKTEHTLAQAVEYFSPLVAGTGEKYSFEDMPAYRALRGESTFAANMEADIGDRYVPLEVWASPIRDDVGNIDSAIVVIEDITQRRQAESELAGYRKHLEELVETRTAELKGANQNLQLSLEWHSYINKTQPTIAGEVSLATAYDLLSARIQQILGATLVFILRWEEQPEITYCSMHAGFDPDVKIIQASFQKDSPLRQNIELGEFLTYSADQVASFSASLGEYFQKHDIQFSILVPLIIRKSVVGVLGVAVTEPAQDFIMQQVSLVERMALDLANLTLGAIVLDQALELAAVEERNNLARDLHDSVTQTLFSANLLTEVLPQIWRNNPELGLQRLGVLQQLTRGALAEMRTFLLELRPSSLTKTPLSDLLKQLTEAVTIRSELSFKLLIEKIPILPEDVQINFYRIAQEALNNIVKHAQARQVTLSLSTMPLTPDSAGELRYEVTLLIQDDGVGYFSMNRQSTQLGVGIMYERAEAIQATLYMKSQPGSGTQITLTWYGLKGKV